MAPIEIIEHKYFGKTFDTSQINLIFKILKKTNKQLISSCLKRRKLFLILFFHTVEVREFQWSVQFQEKEWKYLKLLNQKSANIFFVNRLCSDEFPYCILCVNFNNQIVIFEWIKPRVLWQYDIHIKDYVYEHSNIKMN